MSKEQELKKKKIAEYKRKKLEAEEMIANADLLDYEDDDEENHLDFTNGVSQNHQQASYMGYTENSNGFQDYKINSRDGFGDNSDYVDGAKLH